eukprot:449758-Rhodomonas_salina.1
MFHTECRQTLCAFATWNLPPDMCSSEASAMTGADIKDGAARLRADADRWRLPLSPRQLVRVYPPIAR